MVGFLFQTPLPGRLFLRVVIQSQTEWASVTFLPQEAPLEFATRNINHFCGISQHTNSTFRDQSRIILPIGSL